MRGNQAFTHRTGTVNSLYLFATVAVIAVVGLGFVLMRMDAPRTSNEENGGRPLHLYCAAGIRIPAEKAVAQYRKEYGVEVNLQFGGTNSLLSQIELSRQGDLFISADDSYTTLGQEKGLVRETLPLAKMRPVIAVKEGNPKNIQGIEDLFRDDVITVLGNPDHAAVGKKTRKLLQKSGHWEKLNAIVMNSGVFKPTVPEVASDIIIGSADAGIIWDTTAILFSGLEAVNTPELDKGTAHVTLGVLSSSKQPIAALRFARYLAARDKGLLAFKSEGFEVVEGDKWSENPELTFFCGSVNRRAVEPVVKEFQEREGVQVNMIYNGCGILTAQMRTILDQEQGLGFPDTYMACDVYYLETVKELFQDAVNVSDTEVVIAVAKGNPKNIKSLQDLTQPGIRVTVGQPDQCTIGVLTRQLLEHEGVYDAIMKNVVNQSVSSALLVPSVTEGAADATLAYATDTLAASGKIDVVRIQSTAGKAVQPFSIARSSEQKYLARRLYEAIAKAREQFETAGFHWRLDDVGGIPGSDGLGAPLEDHTKIQDSGEKQP